MSRLNDADNFSVRVNGAAQVTAQGRRSSRVFDNCFENHAGDVVATALERCAAKSPELATQRATATEAARRPPRADSRIGGPTPVRNGRSLK